MKLYDAQDTWDDISERLMRLESSHLQEGAAYEEVSTEFVERNYEDSIAIYNESYAAALDNYISPNEMDAGLLPAGMPSGGLDVEIVTPFEKRDTFPTSENEEAEELVTDDEAVASNPSFAVAHTASPLPAIPEEIEVFEATVDMIPMLGCKSMSSLLPGTPLESLASIALDSPGKVTLLIPGPTDKFDISSTAAGKDLNIFSSIETNIMERNIPESPKSDVDQIRDIGATVVPTACPVPVPPRIHSYKSCKYQRIVSILESEVSSACDVAVDAVLSLLMPHEVQITYRTSARAYLDRAVRLSLNAKIFESGLHALQTFLPDDPVRLTVLLWRGNSTNWLANLTDKMRTLENAGGSAGSKSLPGSMGGMMMNGMPSFDDDAFGENNFDVDNEPKPTGEHTVSGINPSTNNGHSRLLLNIDSVPVEIMPNGRSDLCFLALVEEIAQLVGKNELFKRSLLLIRGWWTYETSAYVGVSTKNFLSDSVVSVLVCSIFNQYHAVINQPLQALAVFLAEYSDVKWSDVAVTLQGIVPFHSSSVIDNQPWLREPLPSELVSSAILQKHCDFYHMSSTSTSRASSTPAIAVVEVESDTKDTASSSGTTTVSTTPRALLDAVRRETMIPTFAAIPLGSPASSAPPTPGTATPSDPGSASTAATVAAAAAQLSVKEPSAPSTKRTPSDSHCYSPTAVRNFQKRIINVVHPLTNANMISTSMSSDRMGRISQILDMGASDLSSALEGALKISPGEENGICTVQTHFNSFFRGILGRFSGGWRPDIFHNLAAEDSSSSRPGFFSKLADTKR